MHQFFIENIENPKLSKEQQHQVKNVLKMRVNDKIRLVDLKGNGVVAAFNSKNLDAFDIREPIAFGSKNYKLKVIASLIRNERLEWMIQKAAEVGIDELVLLSADHGVVKGYDQKEARKMERFNAIALEASEQSYRQFPMTVRGVIQKTNLKEELSDLNFFADTTFKQHYLDALIIDKSISIIVGPEGGFSASERSLFEAYGYKPVSLGKQILRAETAPMAIGVLTTVLDKEAS